MLELHAHSEYSNAKITDTTNKLKSLIYKSLELGLNGIAITDHEMLSGHIKALQIRDKIQEKNPDFKVILGNEIYLIPEAGYKTIDKFFHFLLLAKDAIGHEQLRILSTRAWERAYHHKGQLRTPTFYSDLEEIVGNNKGHLIASTACLGGFLSGAIIARVPEKASAFIDWGMGLFGENHFFLEVQPGISEDQILANRVIQEFSQKKNCPVIVTNDVHFLRKEDAPVHAAYLNSRDEDREVESFYESTYLKTEEEIKERMPYFEESFVDECIANTELIGSLCTNYSLTAPIIVPERKIPDFSLKGTFSFFYTVYEYIHKFAKSKHDQDRYLLYLIEKGFEEKNMKLTDTNLARIDTELKTLWLISEEMGQRLPAYYNLTQEIIDIMWDDNKGNSLVGVARGSVTGFYICFLIGITQINPIKWGLPEWRHIDLGRPELPKQNWAFGVNCTNRCMFNA